MLFVVCLVIAHYALRGWEEARGAVSGQKPTGGTRGGGGPRGGSGGSRGGSAGGPRGGRGGSTGTVDPAPWAGRGARVGGGGSRTAQATGGVWAGLRGWFGEVGEAARQRTDEHYRKRDHDRRRHAGGPDPRTRRQRGRDVRATCVECGHRPDDRDPGGPGASCDCTTCPCHLVDPSTAGPPSDGTTTAGPGTQGDGERPPARPVTTPPATGSDGPSSGTDPQRPTAPPSRPPNPYEPPVGKTEPGTRKPGDGPSDLACGICHHGPEDWQSGANGGCRCESCACKNVGGTPPPPDDTEPDPTEGDNPMTTPAATGAVDLDLSGFTPRFDAGDVKLRDIKKFVAVCCNDLSVFNEGFTAADMDARTLAAIDELDAKAQGAATDIFDRHGEVDQAADETEHPAHTSVYGGR